ncbi:hypothetical protein NF716_00860 [Lactococcus formosensis]|uniref:hypothetical protein n=1 Tax=Lactococcus formosensis TaxID=1281486 RepID=UPI002434D69E|nr:hypothetical protein [Lactococcus formosensis]MDG6154913.1 hypothetical protein [Lactococcus formosensis]
MKTSDWITLFTTTVALVLSTIAILQTKRSIKLTQESEESANRPYIFAYVETVNSGRFIKYFVIKNFGVTPAKILEISFCDKLDINNEPTRLKSIENTTLAPQQRLISEFEEDFQEVISGHVRYVSLVTGEKFVETFTLNFKTDDYKWSKVVHDKTAETQAIYEATTQIIKSFK